MTASYTAEELDQLDTLRLAFLIDFKKAGRPEVVAALLAKTIVPKAAGLPATKTQAAALSTFSDILQRAAAKGDDDETLLYGIAKVAEKMDENAVSEDQARYWSVIYAEATVACEGLTEDEPQTAPTTSVQRADTPQVWRDTPPAPTVPSIPYGTIAAVEEVRDRSRNWFFVNLAIAVVGAVVSLVSYVAAASSPEGGTYGIFWGAVAFGGFFALRNAIVWAKCTKALRDLRSGPL